MLNNLKNWYNETLLGIKRRDINKPDRLNPMLLMTHAEHIRYDRIVFIKFDSKVVDELKAVGFVQEDRCRYQGSSYTLFWDQFVIELEVVQPSEWPDLVRCVNISNATNYFDLNVIRSALYKDSVE